MRPAPPAAHGAPELAETWDAVLDGSVQFLQPGRGYRVNQDSLILAAFAARGRVAELALDLGAGVGVVALVLHRLGAARRFALVEREPRIAELSRRNLEHAGAPGEVLAADLEKGLPAQLERAAALVVMNPPFFETERHLPKDRLRRDARHGSLAPFLEAARTALSGARARAAIAYPASALAELMDAAHRARLTPKRLRLVHPFATRPARLALLELRLERAASIAIEPPLIEWIRPGMRSPELTEQIGGRR